jgi:hypothetical protein
MKGTGVKMLTQDMMVFKEMDISAQKKDGTNKDIKVLISPALQYCMKNIVTDNKIDNMVNNMVDTIKEDCLLVLGPDGMEETYINTVRELKFSALLELLWLLARPMIGYIAVMFELHMMMSHRVTPPDMMLHMLIISVILAMSTVLLIKDATKISIKKKMYDMHTSYLKAYNKVKHSKKIGKVICNVKSKKV